MTSVFDEGLSRAPAPRRTDGTAALPPSTQLFRVWHWVVRLVLPVLVFLAGQVLYWLWFDNIYARNWANIVGGFWIAFTLAIIMVWLVCAWFASEES
jgi:hypothetical protein